MTTSISEQFRLSAKEWVDLSAAADMLEESKSATLSQMMMAKGDMPVSRAEMIVKASTEWQDYISKMVQARKDANLAKVKLEWLRMRFSEQMSLEATERAERKL
jgi:hypothetical protein